MKQLHGPDRAVATDIPSATPRSSPPSLALRQVRRRQGGFTGAELAIVLAAIIGLGALIGYGTLDFWPKMNAKRVGDGLVQAVNDIRLAAGGAGGSAPYAAIDNENSIALYLAAHSVYQITGATVAHRLGGSGTGTNGTVTAAPAAVRGGPQGSGFTLTLTNVSRTTCPTITDYMGGASLILTVNGDTVKGLDASLAPTEYNAMAARASCTPGDTNTIVATIQ